MIFEDRFEVAAPLDRVWIFFNDPAAAGACIPGLESLTPEGPDTVRVTVKVKVSYIEATFGMRGSCRSILLGAGAFEDELQGIVRTLVENAPLAVRETKAALNQACVEGSPPPEFLETMYARIAACLNSEDVREGRRAFLEKRRPVFRGG